MKSIHEIRESLKLGESKLTIIDNKTGYTVGIIRKDDSQFLVLSHTELIELYILVGKQIKKEIKSSHNG